MREIWYSQHHMKESVRINKYLSDRHYCSRREADRLIESGRVFLNGHIAKLGDKVTESDVIRVEGRDRKIITKKIYMLVNKPAGITVTQNRHSEDNVLDFVGCGTDVVPIGSMDVKDEGLLLLTNDTDFSKRLLKPKHFIDQEFVVETNETINRSHIRQMQNGMKVGGQITNPAKVRHIDETRFAIILSEPKTGLIRQMCDLFGYHVVRLIRTRILTLKMPSTYPIGNSRHLTESEVIGLKKAMEIDVSKPSGKKWKK